MTSATVHGEIAAMRRRVEGKGGDPDQSVTLRLGWKPYWEAQAYLEDCGCFLPEDVVEGLNAAEARDRDRRTITLSLPHYFAADLIDRIAWAVSMDVAPDERAACRRAAEGMSGQVLKQTGIDWSREVAQAMRRH